MSKYTKPLERLSLNTDYATAHGTEVRIIGFAKECGLFIGVSDTYSSPRLYHEDGTAAARQHSNLVYAEDKWKGLHHGDIVEAIGTVNAKPVLRVYKDNGKMYAAGEQFKDGASTVSLDSQLSWKKVGHYQ